jgi:hypothetical protein
MRRFNVFAAAFAYDHGRPAGYRAGTARIGPAIGSRRNVLERGTSAATAGSTTGTASPDRPSAAA